MYREAGGTKDALSRRLCQYWRFWTGATPSLEKRGHGWNFGGLGSDFGACSRGSGSDLCDEKVPFESNVQLEHLVAAYAKFASDSRIAGECRGGEYVCRGFHRVYAASEPPQYGSQARARCVSLRLGYANG